MKTTNAIAVGVISILTALSVSFAQDYVPPKQDKEMTKMGDLGKPTFEKSVDGINIKVWVSGGSSAKPSGTGDMNNMHQATVKLTGESAETSVNQADVKLKITSPSGKSSSETLTKSSDRYEGSLSLPESGSYKINVVVTTSDGKTHSVDFTYKV